MYEVVHAFIGNDAWWLLLDENGDSVGRFALERDAGEACAAMNLVTRAVETFPGLLDGTQDVSAADLIDLWNETLVFDQDGRYKERRET